MDHQPIAMANQQKPRTVRTRTRPADTPTSKASILSGDLGALFSKRPIILGEDEHAYDAFLLQVTRAVEPTDTIEEIWVRDIVDLAWDSQRLRRMKAGILSVARKKALERIFYETDSPGELMMDEAYYTQELAAKWLNGDKESTDVVMMTLRQRDLDLDSIMAQALSDKLNEIERIDRMIASADARRNRVISEIERRRESLARRLRTAVDNATDV